MSIEERLLGGTLADAFKHVYSPQQGVVTFLPITLVMFTKPDQVAFMTPHFFCHSHSIRQLP